MSAHVDRHAYFDPALTPFRVVKQWDAATVQPVQTISKSPAHEHVLVLSFPMAKLGHIVLIVEE
jgi:hypothetical protein